MTQQEQIRQEQSAQMAAPLTPRQQVLQLVSHLFHPLMTMTYVALVLCLFTPFCLYDYYIKFFLVGMVVLFTFVLPVVAICVLHAFHVIGHWALRDVRDRTIPFLVNFICYLSVFLILRNIHALPEWILAPFLCSVVLTFVAWVVSFWWKISAHASGNAAISAFCIMMYCYVPELMPLWLVFGSVIVVGLISSIRVYLGRHTLAQVGCGVLLGIGSLLIGQYIYII